MLIAVANGLVVSSVLFATRKIFGYCFSNEKEVVDYVTKMAPLVCVNVIMDSLQGVLSGMNARLFQWKTLKNVASCFYLGYCGIVTSGIARGCGWQHIGAFVNLGAFYFFGIPVAAVLGFWVKMRGMGLWIGILSGATVQTILLSTITSCISWEGLVCIYFSFLCV